ncbi:DUF2857 domain-containing protein [Thioalkalivibrio sp. ALMg11]|uniref:DUF2857 domain-containing protein n=1 Tax=Thioalkalivibrio sp. ALMg11 TaxID=1158165 RepID=UPI00037436E7|nr:DUF2857 domain-containing protein [Thioalkalivibrio sp. ALMg11]
MSSTTDLTLHVLRYAMSRLQDADMNALSVLGLTPDQASTLADMTFDELVEISRLGHLFIDLQIDADRFDQLLERARDEVQSRQVQDELLRHQADARMMEALFGMTTTDVARRRRVLGLPSQPGRPRSPTSEQAQAMWDAWRAAPKDLPDPDRYLHVARSTGASASAVYRLVAECQHTLTDRAPTYPAKTARPVVDLVHHQFGTHLYSAGGSS